jgi:branched-chain amino acid transport system substrate-binding protein
MEMTYRKLIRTYSVCLILALTLCAGIPFGAMAAETIKIGQLEPLSGPFEANGRTWVIGVQFAVDEQNAKGGLLGRKIEVLKEDDEAKPDVATRKAKKLILENKVDFITSGLGSHVAIALNKVATTHKTIYNCYGSFTDDIMGKEFSRYSFRTCLNLYSLNTTMALLMAKTPYRKFYTIQPDYVSGHVGDRLIREQTKIHLPDATFVGTDFFPLGATKDFGPYITKIIASKADAAYFGGFGPDLINFVKQARGMGLKVPFPIFASLVIHPYLLKELKDDAAGMYWAHQYSMRVKTPENEEMIRRFHEKHKNDRDFLSWWPFPDIAMSVLGWKMTFAAIEKAGSLDPEKIIETFEDNFQWKSPVGLYTMRKCDHQVILPMYGGMIEAGPNPYYNGSIRPDISFPWAGPNIAEFPAEKVTLPPTSTYNPRCP